MADDDRINTVPDLASERMLEAFQKTANRFVLSNLSFVRQFSVERVMLQTR